MSPFTSLFTTTIMVVCAGYAKHAGSMKEHAWTLPGVRAAVKGKVPTTADKDCVPGYREGPCSGVRRAHPRHALDVDVADVHGELQTSTESKSDEHIAAILHVSGSTNSSVMTARVAARVDWFSVADLTKPRSHHHRIFAIIAVLVGLALFMYAVFNTRVVCYFIPSQGSPVESYPIRATRSRSMTIDNDQGHEQQQQQGQWSSAYDAITSAMPQWPPSTSSTEEARSSSRMSFKNLRSSKASKGSKVSGQSGTSATSTRTRYNIAPIEPVVTTTSTTSTPTRTRYQLPPGQASSTSVSAKDAPRIPSPNSDPSPSSRQVWNVSAKDPLRTSSPHSDPSPSSRQAWSLIGARTAGCLVNAQSARSSRSSKGGVVETTSAGSKHQTSDAQSSKSSATDSENTDEEKRGFGDKASGMSSWPVARKGKQRNSWRRSNRSNPTREPESESD